MLYPTVSQLVNQTKSLSSPSWTFCRPSFCPNIESCWVTIEPGKCIDPALIQSSSPKTGPSSLDLESSDSDEVLIFNAFPGTKPTSSFCCQAGAGVNAVLFAGLKLATTFKFCKLVRQDWTG